MSKLIAMQKILEDAMKVAELELRIVCDCEYCDAEFDEKTFDRLRKIHRYLQIKNKKETK